jgi:hypothetical protein
MRMTGLRSWSVDELAANRLVAELELVATDDTVAQIAHHFAQHRRSMMEWAAQRIRDNMREALESASTSNFSRHGDAWVSGFNRAEELLLTLSPAELLSLEREQPRSQGQYLRQMIREARQD